MRLAELTIDLLSEVPDEEIQAECERFLALSHGEQLAELRGRLSMYHRAGDSWVAEHAFGWYVVLWRARENAHVAESD